MGWRGAIRAIGAASRAADRENQRRYKAQAKAQMASQSEAAVAALDDYLGRLVSVHANLAESVDWRAMAAKPQPAAPKLEDTNLRAAQTALANFKPGLFDVFAGGTKKRRSRLEQKLAEAPLKDEANFTQAKAAHAAQVAECEADVGLARRLIDGDPTAIKSVLEEMQSALQGDGYVGDQIDYKIENGYMHATPRVHGVDIIPAYRRKQLASGRLSQTKMPTGELNELYQDYVASVALKIAGDLFQILPIEEVYVTCETEMVNAQTGHKEPTPILSVQFVRPTFSKLNLAPLDPSEAMRNFRHTMSFKRTTGFQRIEPLSPPVKAQ